MRYEELDAEARKALTDGYVDKAKVLAALAVGERLDRICELLSKR